jgi:hypothetical protein
MGDHGRGKLPLTIVDRRYAEGAPPSPDDYYPRRSVLTGATGPRLQKGASSPSEQAAGRYNRPRRWPIIARS